MNAEGLLQPRNIQAHLRVPLCAAEPTTHYASAHLAPQQTMTILWYEAPCPGMARDQDLKNHLWFVFAVVQT